MHIHIVPKFGQIWLSWFLPSQWPASSVSTRPSSCYSTRCHAASFWLPASQQLPGIAIQPHERDGQLEYKWGIEIWLSETCAIFPARLQSDVTQRVRKNKFFLGVIWLWAAIITLELLQCLRATCGFVRQHSTNLRIFIFCIRMN